MNCPICLAELGPMMLEGVGMEFCVACRGLWFEKDAAAFMTDMLSDYPNPLGSRTEGKRTPYICPRCKGKLEEVLFAPPPHVRMEGCRSCGGVWLDREEFKKVVENASGFERPRSKIIRAARLAKPIPR